MSPKKLRVLWFANNPGTAKETMGQADASSGSWIEATEKQIKKTGNVSLALAFLTHGKKTRKIHYEGGQYYAIAQKSKIRVLTDLLLLKKTAFDACEIADLQEVINEFKPDIIHIYGTENVYGLVAQATNIPIVVRIQGILQEIDKYWLKNISAIDVFMSFNPAFITKSFYQHFRFKRSVQREKEIFSATRNYICQSDWDSKITGILSPKGTQHRINTVVRSEFFNKEWHPHQNRKKLRLFTIAQARSYKGLEQILQVASILKKSGCDFKWHVAGINSQEQLLKIFERKSGIKYKEVNITFLGILKESEVISQFLNCNIYVHTSHIENGCNSLTEAQVLGIPSIANFAGGMSSTMVHRVTGIFTPNTDALAMAGEILHLQKNPDEATNLGKTARQRALKEFNTKISMQKLLEVYHLLTNKD